MNAINNSELPRSVFRKEQNQIHSMQGNHIAGVATPTSGAQQVEMWFGRMDANSATPPHSHDTEEVVKWSCSSREAGGHPWPIVKYVIGPVTR